MDVDVVVVGAGMGGLVSARHLMAQVFVVLGLESHEGIGGQWDTRNPNSGVWPAMRTNTASFLTRFSDVEYPEGTSIFPRNSEVLDLLHTYADRHDLLARFRFGARVTVVARREGGGYVVRWEQEGREEEARADRVVVATGRYNRPEIPQVEGLDSFSGVGGVSHAFHYKEKEPRTGERVLVCGGSISALEIASDLAMAGAEVHLAQRRQRYVMPKMVAGTPIESYVFSREHALALESLPQEELHRLTAERVLRLGGDPQGYGAPAPHPDIARAGVTGSPHYLNLVAEDRISVHPWVSRVDGRRVEFTDGSATEVDTVIVATGFDLSLPFLSEEISQIVGLNRKTMRLAEFTFHPDLDGLAFVGLWPQLGPYAVPLEQQARWIANVWGGVMRGPTRAELESMVAHCVEEDHFLGYREQHEMAVRFARLAGVDPVQVDDPELALVLPRATTSADAFRIVGPDADPLAGERVKATFWRYGAPEDKAAVRAAMGRTSRPGCVGSDAG